MTNTPTNRIGVCSWSLKPKGPDDLVASVKELGLRQVQLALGPLNQQPDVWGDAPRKLRDAGIRIASGMFGTVGENYATLETIKQTGGLIADEHWLANRQLAEQTARLAAELGLTQVSFHAGFIPHDHNDPLFTKLLDRIRTVADIFAERDIELLFETGQETADDLLGFLEVLDRPHVGVNFDPANMILYGKGDPVDAVRKLMLQVRQVHIKDAKRTDTPGTWGQETPVGQGEVDWPAFIGALAAGGYDGALIIEREAGEHRMQEVRQAIDLIAPLL